MSIISRYIAISWIKLFMLCQGGFLAIYLIVDFMEKLGRFSRAGAGFSQIARFFLFKTPEMIGQTISFAMLMATLLTLGMLSRSSEVTALRSCGRSIPQLVTPILLLAVVCSSFMLVNAELIVPDSYRRMEYVEKVLIRKEGTDTFFRLNNIWFRSEQHILQANVFDPETKTLKGVTVWELSSDMEPLQRLDAELAKPDQHGWLLEKVTNRTFAKDNKIVKLAEVTIPLTLKVEDLRILDNNAANLSYKQLQSYAKSLEKGGYPANRWLTMMHMKLASPFGGIIMVLLGIPFALKTGRSAGVAKGIGASVAIGFTYFMISAVIQSYGRTGLLPPIIAAWGANIVFTMLAIWLAMTVKQQ